MTEQTASDISAQEGTAFGALAHARGAGRPGARAVRAGRIARTALRLGFSGSVALLVGRLVMNQPVEGWVPLVTIGLLLAATLAGFACDRVQAGAETRVAIAVGDAALQRLRMMPSRQIRRLSPGALTVSMQRHPEALAALVRHGAPQAARALRLYRERFDGDALTLDKWFSLQATQPEHAALERVQALTVDPAFTLANPNRVHSLLGAFARSNPVAFHRPDGAGHRWFADKLVEIDRRNPQLSARLTKAFEDWPRLEPQRRASAESVLRGLLARTGRSPDLTEVLTRMLDADTAA